MFDEEQFSNQIKSIPDDGFWTTHAEEMFVQTGLMLVEDYEINPDVVIGILQDLYYAVAGEFGN